MKDNKFFKFKSSVLPNSALKLIKGGNNYESLDSEDCSVDCGNGVTLSCKATISCSIGDRWVACDDGITSYCAEIT